MRFAHNHRKNAKTAIIRTVAILMVATPDVKQATGYKVCTGQMDDKLPFYECYLRWYTDEYMRKFHEFMKWFADHQHELPPEWFGVPLKANGAVTTNPAYIGNVSED